MPRFPVQTIQDAPAASRPALERISTAMGRTLNLRGEMAASPAVTGAYQGIGAAIRQHGTFDARTREAIALAEAFAHVAANLFTNYFNHYARTDLDIPAAPEIPGA